MTSIKKGSYFIHLFIINRLDLSHFKRFYLKEFWPDVNVLDSVFLIDSRKNPVTGKTCYSIMVYIETNNPIFTAYSHTILYRGETINSSITDYEMRKLALSEILQSNLLKTGNKNFSSRIFISTMSISEIASHTI
jgi:hypothetical protein